MTACPNACMSGMSQTEIICPTAMRTNAEQQPWALAARSLQGCAPGQTESGTLPWQAILCLNLPKPHVDLWASLVHCSWVYSCHCGYWAKTRSPHCSYSSTFV